MKHIIDDADKNKYEAYSKQEVLNVIQEAISSGELPEEINGLVLTFKNPVDNQGYKIAFCTQAQYNTMESQGTLESNCYYYITDDTSLDGLDDMQDDINELQTDVSDLQSNVSDLQSNKRDKETIAQCTESSGTITCDYDFYNSNSSKWANVILRFNGNYMYYNSITTYSNRYVLIYSNEKYKFTVTVSRETSPLIPQVIDYVENAQHLYKHDIEYYVGPEKVVYFSLYLDTNEVLTNVTLANYMEDNKNVSATGYYKATPNADPETIISFYKAGTTWYARTYQNVSRSISNTTSVDSAFSDNVSTIL